MKNFNKIILSFLFLGLVIVPARSDNSTSVDKLLILNKNFFYKLNKLSPIQRDNYFLENNNKIIQTRAIIKKIDRNGRYKKKFRIILYDPDAIAYKLNISYYVFLDDEDSITILSENELFEFSGQLAAHTPVTTKRDSYILDIIFEKGAVIVK